METEIFPKTHFSKPTEQTLLSSQLAKVNDLWLQENKSMEANCTDVFVYVLSIR